MDNKIYEKEGNPLVSVIIPTYNRAYVLKESIFSVVNQTYKNIEIIIVDDCSSDDTERVVSEIEDSRIVYIRNTDNKGASASRNIGAKIAKGKYLAFNDSDDLWMPNKLEDQIQSMRSTGCDIAYCYLKRTRNNDSDYSEIVPQNGKKEDLSGELHQKLLINNFIALPTVILKKDIFILENGFNSQLKAVEDYEFFLRITRNREVVFVDQILVDSRDFGDGINDITTNAKNICDGILYILQKYEAEIEQEQIESQLEVILEEVASWLDKEDYLERLGQIQKYANWKKIEDLRYIEELSNSMYREKIKLSIIIPFYNSEKYLRQCLESVAEMKFCPVEIICINDGSTDSSAAIVEKLAIKDYRIILINKENSGYGDSVNLGIKYAKGEYVGIVESDDIADAIGFKKMVEVANATGADIVKGNYSTFSNDITETQKVENLFNMPYYKLFSLDYAPFLAVTAPAIWSGIYKRKFLIDKKIELLNSPGAAYQDTAFAFITFALADSIYLIEDNTIYYRIDSEMSSSNSNNKVFDIFNETDYIREILIKNSLEKYLPLLARTKMQGQAWNYNRIGDEKKTEFMVRWHEDAIKDYVQGNIRKEYWDDETWLRINEVIFNPYNLRQLERNTPKEQTIKQQLVCLLRDIPNIYILGKGTYAISLANILAKYDVDITAFVVLNVTGDNILQEGKIPVVSLETISRDDILLKGVLEGDDLLKEARMRFYSVCDLRYHLVE